MYCPNCGTQHPDAANFCMNCGRAFRRRTSPQQTRSRRWEYKDLVIPVGWGEPGNPSDWAKLDRLIEKHLEDAEAQGWEADDPTDFETLLLMCRVNCACPSRSFNPRKVSAVTIRMKRLA